MQKIKGVARTVSDFKTDKLKHGRLFKESSRRFDINQTINFISIYPE